MTIWAGQILIVKQKFKPQLCIFLQPRYSELFGKITLRNMKEPAFTFHQCTTALSSVIASLLQGTDNRQTISLWITFRSSFGSKMSSSSTFLWQPMHLPLKSKLSYFRFFSTSQTTHYQYEMLEIRLPDKGKGADEQKNIQETLTYTTQYSPNLSVSGKKTICILNQPF